MYVAGYMLHCTALLFRSLTGEKSRHWPNYNIADGKQTEIVCSCEGTRNIRKYKQELISSGMRCRVVWWVVRDFVRRSKRLELI